MVMDWTPLKCVGFFKTLTSACHRGPQVSPDSPLSTNIPPPVTLSGWHSTANPERRAGTVGRIYYHGVWYLELPSAGRGKPGQSHTSANWDSFSLGWRTVLFQGLPKHKGTSLKIYNAHSIFNLCRITYTYFGTGEQQFSHRAAAVWQAAILLHITNKVRKVHGESLFQDKFEQQCKHGLKVTHSCVTSIRRHSTLSERDWELMRNKGLSPPVPGFPVGKSLFGEDSK